MLNGRYADIMTNNFTYCGANGCVCSVIDYVLSTFVILLILISSFVMLTVILITHHCTSNRERVEISQWISQI